ncbi:hypothetical protein QN239_20240 [Mycolicibacterium sp. Y3]
MSWKDALVPRPHPCEVRDDVVRVARNRDDGVTIEQKIATDFGVRPTASSKPRLMRACVVSLADRGRNMMVLNRREPEMPGHLDDGGNELLVVSQSPAPEERIGTTAPITLSFANPG